MEFPLTGEPLALDLVNTRTSEGDLLATPAALDTWLATQTGRLPAPERPATAADLAAVRALRDHVATAIDYARRADGADPAAALGALEAALRGAPAYRALRWDGGVVAEHRRAGAYRARLLADLADTAVALLTDPVLDRIRQCEGPGCVLLFLPAHARRRWCSPALCGNRVRVARHYERHRTAGR